MKRVVTIGASVVVAVAAAIWGVTAAVSEPSMPAPPWANAATMPDRVEVVGPDGGPCLDANGNQVTVPLNETPPPPSEIEPDSSPRRIEKDSSGRTVEIIEEDDDYGCEDLGGCQCAAPPPQGWEKTAEYSKNEALVRLEDSYFERAEARTVTDAERLDAEIARNKVAVQRLMGMAPLFDNPEPTGMYRVQTASSRREEEQSFWTSRWRTQSISYYLSL